MKIQSRDILIASGTLGIIAIVLLLNFQTHGSASQNSKIFIYNFQSPGTLEEAGASNESTSPYWWVNSGAYLTMQNGIGATAQGNLPDNNPWRILYAKNNPIDTDNGYQPQNIFRLISQNQWADATESAYFNIQTYNVSSSPNRMESNGILLFTRYVDSQNLYYAGLRVDGTAVIKKKIAGIYYTMAQGKILPGIYDRDKNPNLLPLHEWIGLKLETKTLPGNVLLLTLSADFGRNGNWVPLLSTLDDGTSFGGPAFTQSAHNGIRTDFMDVEFSDFEITPQ